MNKNMRCRLAALALLTAMVFSAMAFSGCSSAVEKDAEDEIQAAEDSGTSESPTDVSSDLTEYTIVQNADCVSLKADGKEYVPFSAADKSQIGKQIGWYEDSTENLRENIYEVNGQSLDQWIIAAQEDEKDPMIYRELSVTEYPEGFKSDYAWN